MSKKEKHQNEAWLTKAHLTNYKSIRDMEVEFKAGLNIIIGKNGSGKTNLMEYLDMVVRPDLYSAPGEVYYSVEFPKSTWEYKVTPRKNSAIEVENGTYSSGPEFERQYRKHKKAWQTMGSSPEAPLSGPEIKTIYFKYNLTDDQYFIAREGRYPLVPSRYDASSALSDRLGRNPSFLLVEEILIEIMKFELWDQETLIDILSEKNQSMLEKKKTALANRISAGVQSLLKPIVKPLSKFSPVKDLKLKKDSTLVQVNHRYQSIEVSDIQIQYLVEGDWLTFDQLSDGTKRLFGIMSSILLPSRSILLPNDSQRKWIMKVGKNAFPKIILLEEPELGIHPQQLFELMTFVKEQSRHQQIIITTHSPTVLDVLDIDELDRVLVCNYTQEKGTQVKRLEPNIIKKVQAYVAENFKISDAWLHSPNFEPDA